jgi:predicted nucleic acid-binding protein
MLISIVSIMILAQAIMYLVDANVISEMRKCVNTDKGVQSFFKQVIKENSRVFISVVSAGELRRGVELIRHRGDTSQANRLE